MTLCPMVICNKHFNKTAEYTSETKQVHCIHEQELPKHELYLGHIGNVFILTSYLQRYESTPFVGIARSHISILLKTRSKFV